MSSIQCDKFPGYFFVSSINVLDLYTPFLILLDVSTLPVKSIVGTFHIEKSVKMVSFATKSSQTTSRTFTALSSEELIF